MIRMAFVTLLALAGCSDPQAEPTPATASSASIYRTVVRFDGSGVAHSATFQVTAETAERERTGRAQPPSTGIATAQLTAFSDGGVIDPSCAGADLWIYDALNCQPAQANVVNEICLFGQGTAYL